MDQWKGKVVVVTGASSGIGRAIAVDLLHRGVHVAGLARRLDRMNDLKTEEKYGAKFLPIQCDVTKNSDIKSSFDKVVSTLGAPDAFINNAGVAIIGELKSCNLENAKLIFETNVLSMIAATKETLAHMKPGGTIIVINSIVSHCSGIFGGGVYSGSKQALLGLTETLRTELAIQGSQIRVTTISPGAVRTEMVTPQMRSALGDSLALLEAEDIADCVTFVLSLPSRVNISEMVVEPRDSCKVQVESFALQLNQKKSS